MEKVYDLRDDHVLIRQMQEATLDREAEVGLSAEPALVGSEEWWALLGGPELPLRTATGVIEAVFMSGHNDFPECRLREEDGSASNWAWSDAKRWWQEGMDAKIEYVEHPWKPTNQRRDDKRSQVVIRIWLGTPPSV